MSAPTDLKGLTYSRQPDDSIGGALHLHCRGQGSSPVQGPVSQKSRTFSGFFRVPLFPSYLRNAEVLSLQTSNPRDFSYIKNM